MHFAFVPRDLIRALVAECRVCHAKKPAQRARAPLRPMVFEHPSDRIQVRKRLERKRMSSYSMCYVSQIDLMDFSSSPGKNGVYNWIVHIYVNATKLGYIEPIPAKTGTDRFSVLFPLSSLSLYAARS